MMIVKQVLTSGVGFKSLSMFFFSSSSTDGCVPDQRVTHLLSSMLKMDKPSDLIHAAAAFLRRGNQ